MDIREEGLSRLAAWLIQEQITSFQSSANVFRYFLDTLTGAEEFCALRLIALGGAQVTGKDVELKLPDYIILLPLSFWSLYPSHRTARSTAGHSHS